MNNKIVKLQLGDYFKWNNLSREDKVKRNKQIAKLYLDKGPSILNYYNALKAYFGGFNPKNPYLLTGEPIITPGMNPTKGILTAAKAARTLEDYLKTTKVTAQALEGSSAARSAYATDRYLGGVMFENNLPEAASQIQGHGMAKASTLLENLARLRYILDNGLEKGKTFFTAPLKVSDARIGSVLGTGGGKPYFDGHFLITGKPGQMINSVDDIGTIYINDAYENEEALKAALKIKTYLQLTYPNKTFKLYSEGFKKNGGTIKTANARKWKHKEGGIIKANTGTQLNTTTNNSNSKINWKSLLNTGVDYIGQMLPSILNSGGNSSSLQISDTSDAMTDTTLLYLILQQQQAQAIRDLDTVLKSLYDRENPNANGGDIVRNYYKLLILAPQLAQLKELQLLLKKLLDTLNKLKKASVINDALTTTLLTGLGLVSNYIGNKKGSSVS